MNLSTIISGLIAILLVLYLSRLSSKFLLVLFGQTIYNFLLWPGVVIHELSHLLGAVITFTRVHGFSLWPKKIDGGTVLGSVTHEASNNPITLIIISIFPLLGGTFILWLVTMLLPQAPVAPVFNVSSEIWLNIVGYFTSWFTWVINLWQVFDFTIWQTWVFVYLTFCIAAHLSPSTHYLKYTAAGLTALSLLIILIVFISQLLGQNIGVQLAILTMGAITFLLPLLSYAAALLLLVVIISGLAFGLKKLVR